MAESSSLELTPDDSARLTPDERAHVLTHGELEIIGRLTDASNVTLLASAELDGSALHCVYKPIRGERPLWDFPDGSLAEREVAAALVAAAAGWTCVPPTVLRDGPFGTGMVQLWIDGTDSSTVVDVFAVADLPDGWLPVLQALDAEGDPVLLAHADDERLATLAVFDLLVNNADRKGSHLLPVPGGPLYGVDHGLTMHQQPKLRTVLWGWAGQPLPEPAQAGLQLLADSARGHLGEELAELLTVAEVAAFRTRLDMLVAKPQFRTPPRDRTPIPWPAL